MKRKTFADGDVIFREGEPSDAAYLVVSGIVDVVIGFGSPDAKTIAVLGKGEYFGEMGAIDNCPRSATAVAKGDVDCVAVTSDEFMETLVKEPKEAIELLKVLFERLRRADRRTGRA
jgi:CRP/FNR family transcriptional regulator, cyclic AMP receptor protein